MTYSYKCPICNHVTDLIQSIKDSTPKSVSCEECGQDASRDWGSGGQLHIPESFKAGSEIYGADDLSNPSVIGRRLNQNRPSGKSKIYY